VELVEPEPLEVPDSDDRMLCNWLALKEPLPLVLLAEVPDSADDNALERLDVRVAELPVVVGSFSTNLGWITLSGSTSLAVVPTMAIATVNAIKSARIVGR